MSNSRIVYLATALVILLLAVHPKTIMVKKATQQPHRYQALARLCLVAMSLFILWFGFSNSK
jgi:drug/metabolite transporter (DMT)-like permease